MKTSERKITMMEIAKEATMNNSDYEALVLKEDGLIKQLDTCENILSLIFNYVYHRGTELDLQIIKHIIHRIQKIESNTRRKLHYLRINKNLEAHKMKQRPQPSASDKLAEDILLHVDIVDTVKKFVDLEADVTIYRGSCPFHRDQHRSFFVDPKKQMFYCHGCGTVGNVIKFNMDINNMSFKEALKKMADDAGISKNDN
jgi:hypothetical protein